MECPKCGYMMDAFTSECPRCARMGTPVTTAVAPPLNAQAAPYAGHYPVASSVASPVGLLVNTKQIVALVGALLLGLGVFTPFVSISLFGSISFNLLQVGQLTQSSRQMAMMMGGPHNGKIPTDLLFMQYAGYVLLLLAVGTIVIALAKWPGMLWLTGGTAFIIAAVIIGYYFVGVGKANAQMQQMMASLAQLQSSPLAHLSLFSIIALGWAAVFLLCGAVVVLTAAALSE